MDELFVTNLKDLYFNLAQYIQFVVENISFEYLTNLVNQGEVIEDYENCKKKIEYNNSQIDKCYDNINIIITLCNIDSLNQIFNEFNNIRSDVNNQGQVNITSLYILYLLLSQINFLISKKYVSPEYYLEKLTPQLREHKIAFKEFINDVIDKLALDQNLKIK